MAEASNSLNLFAQHPSGYTVQLTIRSENSADLLARFEKLLAWLQEHNCRPATRPDGWWAPAATPEPVLANNGHAPASSGQTQPSNGKPAPTLPDGNPDPAWCPIHNVTMKRRESNGQVWYSHKAGDAWCKGKPPKNGNGY
jgi:uncharacterized protein YecE (DUF72 family)